MIEARGFRKIRRKERRRASRAIGLGLNLGAGGDRSADAEIVR